MKKEIVALPKFMPGQVIDLSYKTNTLPERVLIVSVFTRRQDTQWMYSCLTESTGETVTIDQSTMIQKMTDKSAKVYQCGEIINMYNAGWRFCGNYKSDFAHGIATNTAKDACIKSLILKPALNGAGNTLPGHYGMWVKFHNMINNDGEFIRDTADTADVIVIK